MFHLLNACRKCSLLARVFTILNKKFHDVFIADFLYKPRENACFDDTLFGEFCVGSLTWTNFRFQTKQTKQTTISFNRPGAKKNQFRWFNLIHNNTLRFQKYLLIRNWTYFGNPKTNTKIKQNWLTPWCKWTSQPKLKKKTFLHPLKKHSP